MVWASHLFLSALSVRPQNAPTRTTVFKIRTRMILWCDGQNELINSALENCLSAWKKKHLDSPNISKLKRFEFWLACWPPKKMNLTASSCTTRYMCSSFFKHTIFQQPSENYKKTWRASETLFFCTKKIPAKMGVNSQVPPTSKLFKHPYQQCQVCNDTTRMDLETANPKQPKQPTSPLVTSKRPRLPWWHRKHYPKHRVRSSGFFLVGLIKASSAIFLSTPTKKNSKTCAWHFSLQQLARNVARMSQ